MHYINIITKHSIGPVMKIHQCTVFSVLSLQVHDCLAFLNPQESVHSWTRETDLEMLVLEVQKSTMTQDHQITCRPAAVLSFTYSGVQTDAFLNSWP